jgi:dTDP-4-dehydrorhamnose 3,5-epimerase/CDP-3, 6-dideoxy-D-glycero-D-glycero-4-hexulose-5-epimerase
MKIRDQILPGCFVLEPAMFSDHRGNFVKTFHDALYREAGMVFQMREEFYSTSRTNTVRGMHFQTPPYEHDKLVYCTRGAVLDVLLDLRPGRGYGRSASIVISSDNMFQIFVPKGIAHGFLSLNDDSLMLYKTSTVHSPNHDRGVRWDSFGFDWGVTDPIISRRDLEHPPLSAFDTPFMELKA